MNTATASPPPTTGLAALIGRLAGRLAALGTGPRADLRRLRADATDRWRSAAFYRIYADAISPDQTGDDEHQRRWAMILAGMTKLDHHFGCNAGAALADNGFSERRLVRLLDADQDHLAAELRALVSFLAAKGAAVNWTDLADLVLSCGGERHDAVRRRLAAAYYRTISSLAKKA
jgi:CRISPR type I-E-associated protein CasB/Cse2